MIIAVVGVTASGKSDLALDIAQHLGGEIVSADAYQLYKGMDIGTAKVTASQQRGIRHYQLDQLEICEKASVAAYQKAARADILRIYERGKVPIIAGGSGLYVRAVLDKINFPGTDARVRARLEQQLAEAGPGELRRRLERLDPKAATTIEPNNLRRIVRALEVIEITGKPFTANLPDGQYFQPTLQIGLDRADIDQRVGARTRAMFDAGFVSEVETLVTRGLLDSPTAQFATGYQQVISHLAGDISRDEAIGQTALATRQLVRKQRKWFRRDKRIHWFSAGEQALRQTFKLFSLAERENLS